MELNVEQSESKDFFKADVGCEDELENCRDSNSELELEQMKRKEIQKAVVVCKKGLEDCGMVSSCQLGVGSKKVEERCAELELEIRKKNIEYEALERKFIALEAEKVTIEDQLKTSNRICDELKDRIACIEGDRKLSDEAKKRVENYVDLTEEDEEDKVVQLLIENKVLECEKKRAETELEEWKEKFNVLDREKKTAESEAKVWREKFEKLELRVIQLDKSLELRHGRDLLDGRIKVGLELPNLHFKEVNGTREMSEVNKLKYGFHAETNSDFLQTKERAAELDTSFTRNSPNKGIGDAPAAGTSGDTPHNLTACIEDEKLGVRLEPKLNYGRRARRYLTFEEKSSTCGKIAPATPGCPKPSYGVIDICDSDDECGVTPIQTPNLVSEGSLKISLSADVGKKETIPENNVNDQCDIEDMDVCNENLLFVSTPKRKRASNIVTSDSESDDDDDKVPICRLKRTHHNILISERKSSDSKSCPVTANMSGSDNAASTVIPPRRRLMTLRQCEGQDALQQKPSSKLKNGETKDHLEIPTINDAKDDESEEVGLESEGESLGGFIVHSSDVSDSEDDTASPATACRGNNVTGTSTPPRQRLRALRQCQGQGTEQQKPSSKLKNSETKDHVEIPTTTNVENDHELEEVGSESEGESLGGFIVDSSNVSDCDNDTASIMSQDESDDDVDFHEILSSLRGNKKHKTEWEFEADMLAAFGKDPELCMKAVCALYRQQTADEKVSKETLHNNCRGFSKLDAIRGSALAEFITDGDPNGEVKKSVKELQAYDQKAVELCRTLATRYSKQLFEIYKNKEDPLFLPC